MGQFDMGAPSGAEAHLDFAVRMNGLRPLPFKLKPIPFKLTRCQRGLAVYTQYSDAVFS